MSNTSIRIGLFVSIAFLCWSVVSCATGKAEDLAQDIIDSRLALGSDFSLEHTRLLLEENKELSQRMKKAVEPVREKLESLRKSGAGGREWTRDIQAQEALLRTEYFNAANGTLGIDEAGRLVMFVVTSNSVAVDGLSRLSIRLDKGKDVVDLTEQEVVDAYGRPKAPDLVVESDGSCTYRYLYAGSGASDVFEISVWFLRSSTERLEVEAVSGKYYDNPYSAALRASHQNIPRWPVTED